MRARPSSPRCQSFSCYSWILLQTSNNKEVICSAVNINLVYVCLLTAPSIVKRFWKFFFVWKDTVLWWYNSWNQDMMRESRGLRKYWKFDDLFFTFTDVSVNSYGKIKSFWNFFNFKRVLKFFLLIIFFELLLYLPNDQSIRLSNVVLLLTIKQFYKYRELIIKLISSMIEI